MENWWNQKRMMRQGGKEEKLIKIYKNVFFLVLNIISQVTFLRQDILHNRLLLQTSRTNEFQNGLRYTCREEGEKPNQINVWVAAVELCIHRSKGVLFGEIRPHLADHAAHRGPLFQSDYIRKNKRIRLFTTLLIV